MKMCPGRDTNVFVNPLSAYQLTQKSGSSCQYMKECIYINTGASGGKNTHFINSRLVFILYTVRILDILKL